MKLFQGRIRTTFTGEVDKSGNPIPYGYTVDTPDRSQPDCLACADCGVALAQVWPSRRDGGFIWCTRGEDWGKAQTSKEAFADAEAAIGAGDHNCELKGEDAAQ